MAAPVKKSLRVIDESNPNSYLADGRNPQKDYYRLENRERQLAAIENLTEEEQAYVLGGVNADDAVAGDNIATIKKAVTKIHEADLIELRALVHLQKLPDTSPELIQLKAVTGLASREEIAQAIAKRQLKKLMDSQLDAITSPADLKRVYATTIQRGGQAFAGLWGVAE
jgi:hypothetical protein